MEEGRPVADELVLLAWHEAADVDKLMLERRGWRCATSKAD